MYPIKNCRLWMLSIVVIVLAAASSAASQVTKDLGEGSNRLDLSDTDPVLSAPPAATGTANNKTEHYVAN